MHYQVATGFLQLCAVSSPPLRSAIGGWASTSQSQSGSDGNEDPFLVNKLVELGAVPPLLRLQSLSYPHLLREGARILLRPLLRIQGDAVRSAAEDVSIPQPIGTSPADWVAWRQQFEQDLYGVLA